MASKHVISIYKNFSKFLVLNHAKYLLADDYHLVKSYWTLNDVVSSKARTVNITYTLYSDGEVLSKSPPMFQDDDVIFDVYSKCCTNRATCFERKLNGSSNAESKENVVYIWHGDEVVKCINLKDLDSHGLIYKKDFNVGGFQWLSDNRHIVYVAETKKPKHISHFQVQPKKDINVGDQYRSKDDFGEQLGHFESPVVCVLNVLEETVNIIDILPDGYIPGQIFVHPTEECFIIRSYKKLPYHLGLIYCMQRCSELFYYNMKSKELKLIGDKEKSKSSARFSLDGKKIIWLENDACGAHMQCQRIMSYDCFTQTTEIVVDIIHDSLQQFTGIYSLGLTENCWHTDNCNIFLSTFERGRSILIVVNIMDKVIQRLELEDYNASVQLLDLNKESLLIKVSSPSIMPFIAVVNINDSLQSGKLSLKPISAVNTIDNIEWQFLNHSPSFSHPKYGVGPLHSIFISPNNSDKCPLILALHGGPHSSFTSEFQLFFAAAAELGFCSLLVNYRGSWGYGQDSINSLLGYVGEMDVQDCIDACNDVLDRFSSKVDASNIFLYGGSHGGFLAAHLASKYSHCVRAMACRNPVINIPAMVTSTDIPDWTYTETGFSWDHTNILNDEILLKMWTMSPIKYVDNIKCPVFVMIGSEDKRVPPSQGRELARALKARGLPCELHVYPKDCHPLASVEATSDCFVNVINWFNKYLKK